MSDRARPSEARVSANPVEIRVVAAAVTLWTGVVVVVGAGEDVKGMVVLAALQRSVWQKQSDKPNTSRKQPLGITVRKQKRPTKTTWEHN